MLDENENQGSNPEGEQGTNPEAESYDEVAKVKEYGKNQKIRAEKAEKDLKVLKAKLAKLENPGDSETPKNEEKSNEHDYSEKIDKLILKSEGITHSDDVKIVLAEAKRLILPVEEVAGMEHIKTKLKTLKEQREAEAGMPEGSGKPGGTNKGTVEHWINKKNPDGTYQTPSDTELAGKVIDARMKKEGENNKFSDILFS